MGCFYLVVTVACYVALLSVV